MQHPLFGATLLTAGTAIGGAMLALPIVSATVGFGLSCLILAFVSAFMLYSSLVIVNLMDNHPNAQSLSDLAYSIWGVWGERLYAVLLMMLFYALLAAYISGGAGLIHSLMPVQTGNLSWLTPQTLSVFFALSMGFVIYKQILWIERFNRWLFMAKLAVLGVLVTKIIPHTNVSYLTHTPTKSLGVYWWVVPIFFTSFGFHGSIPTLYRYLDGNKTACIKAFTGGVLLSLIIYILWEGAIFAYLPASTLTDLRGIDDLVALFAQQGLGNISTLVSAFTLLAVLTSFLGVGIGLFDLLCKHMPPALGAVATFSPPLFCGLFYPHMFMVALGYAAIVLSLMAIILPTFMHLTLNKSLPIGLGLNLIFGLLIIGLEIASWF